MKEETPCACVSPDAIECARKRDGFDLDDKRWQRRQCTCECHEEDDEDDDQ